MRAFLPVVAISLPAALFAQTPPAAAPGGGVTRADYIARQEARLMAADSDGDGRISRAEMDAAMAARGGGGRHGDPARRFARMDANGDGYADKAEIDAMLGRRFDRLDTNHDGILSPDERMAARAAMKSGAPDGP